MSEQMNFTEENKKTIISFIVGLLIGGLLVYIFALPAEAPGVVDIDSEEETEVEADEDGERTEEEGEVNGQTPTNSTSSVNVTGEGSITVEDQAAGSRVEIDDITFPAKEGWVGVRDYENDQLTGLLGVARWNSSEGLYPTGVNLLRNTEAGKTYAVVFYHDNGDKVFNLATDAQIQTSIATFVAR
ncbi:MAG: hypothetical protein WDZ56_00835 [Candidatus Paceibacterota bacterium]